MAHAHFGREGGDGEGMDAAVLYGALGGVDDGVVVAAVQSGEGERLLGGAGSVEQHESGGGVGSFSAAEPADEIEHEVEGGGGASRGDHVALVDDHRVGLHVDGGVLRNERVGGDPVGGGAASIQ